MSSPNISLKEVEILTIRVLDELHSSEDLTKLSDLLRTSKEARSVYLDLVVQDSMLHWEAGEVVEFELPYNKAVPFPKIPLFASIAAAIVAVFGVWHLKVNSDDASSHVLSPNRPVASMVASVPVMGREATPTPYALPVNDSLEVGGDNPFSRSVVARLEASRGITILQEKNRLAQGGLYQIFDDLTVWSRQEHLSVPAELGVLPLEGDRMIKLSQLTTDVRSNTAETSDTIRVVDLRNYSLVRSDSKFRLNTKVSINQSVGLVRASTEFSLTVHAIRSEKGEVNRSIALHESSIRSDLNPSTWEDLHSDFEIPDGTDYLVVALNARRDGPSSLIPDLGGFYADQLSLGLFVNDQEKISL